MLMLAATERMASTGAFRGKKVAVARATLADRVVGQRPYRLGRTA
jgi:hypothetical protein